MPSRKQWYFCPHWERFLTRGDQECLLCEPLRQLPAPQQQSVRTRLEGKPLGLRAIFPILNAKGDPLRAGQPSLAG
jgi:hypothetical protein